MKPEELMIDDWVCYSKANKYYTKVNEIRHTEAPLDDQWYIEGMRSDNDKINPNALEYLAVEMLSPVSLTPEILEKNGFEYYRDDAWILSGTHGFVLISEYGGLRYNNHIKLCHVHELQHLLQVCGIDKEIEI